MKIEISIDEYIGRKVKALRRKHKVIQYDLAHKIGFSHMHLSRLERGTSSWKPSYLEKIAQVFNVDIIYFIS